jgi:triacylglycerol lipase
MMADFDQTFAVQTAFPQSVAAYVNAGFAEACNDQQVGPFERSGVIEVDPSACHKVWSDTQLSDRAKGMLETVMADPHKFGFIGINGQSCAIAFRGTRTPSDFLKDIQILPENGRFGHEDDAPPLPGKVHGGFQALYRTLRPSINTFLSSITAVESTSLTITGHSLGAALALLCAVDPMLNRFSSRRVYTFAGPRIGDSDFAAAFDNTVADCFRVVNMSDIVPHLPVPIPYRHVGTAVIVDGFRFALDIPLDEHVLCGGYLRGLNKLVMIGLDHTRQIVTVD